MYVVKSDLNVETGRHIKRLRTRNNLTQTEVADKLGITTPAYSKIESGSTDVNLSRLEQIAHFFRLNVTAVLSDEVAPKPLAELKELKLLRKRDGEIIRLKELITSLESEIFENHV